MVAMPDSAPAQKLDDDTTAALTLFNEYVAADRVRTRHNREIAKAEKAKDQAAAAVRKLEQGEASGEEKATVEAAYRDAVAALKRVRDGESAEAEPETAEAPKEDHAPEEAEASEAPKEDPAPEASEGDEIEPAEAS